MSGPSEYHDVIVIIDTYRRILGETHGYAEGSIPDFDYAGHPLSHLYKVAGELEALIYMGLSHAYSTAKGNTNGVETLDTVVRNLVSKKDVNLFGLDVLDTIMNVADKVPTPTGPQVFNVGHLSAQDQLVRNTCEPQVVVRTGRTSH